MTKLFSSLFGRKPRRRRPVCVFGHWSEDLESRVVLSVSNAITVVTSSASNLTVYDYQFGGTTFGSQVTSSASVGLEYIGMGDFDGDGDQDILMKTPGVQESGFGAQPSNFNVGVNNGSGSFTFSTWKTAAVDVNQGSYTWVDHQIADFNGDGKADLMARDKGTGVWSLWLSTGAAFASPVTFGTWDPGVQWRDIQVGDFDNDGYMDILGRRVTNSTAGGATDEWYIGRGASTITSHGTVNVGGNTWWNITSTDHFGTVANTVVGNFDGVNDGDEIAIRMLDGTNSDGSRNSEWLIVDQNTSGSWSAPTVETSLTNWDNATSTQQNLWRDMQAGDVDGDGIDDIIGRTYSGDWWVSLGGGATTATMMGSAFPVATGIGSTSYTQDPVLLADFKGGSGLEMVYRDVANDRWMMSSYAAGSYGAPTAVGGSSSNQMQHPLVGRTFAIGNSGTSAGTLHTYEEAISNKGSSDPLALLEDESYYLAWSQGTDGSYTTGRFNADGSFDFEDYGGATLSGKFSGPTSGTPLRGDFDGDGLQDILMQGIDTSNPNNWYLMTNRGNAYIPSLASNLPTSWGMSISHYFKVGDFNGDGYDDLLVQYIDTVGVSASGHWVVYLNNNGGTPGSFATGVTIVSSTSSAASNQFTNGGEIGDIDGDGSDDLVSLVKDQTTPDLYNVVVYYSNGSAAWSNVIKWQRQDHPSSAGVRLITNPVDGFIRVGDFDGDGKDDVVSIQNLATINGVTTTLTGELWVGLYDGSRTGVSTSGWVTTLPNYFNPSNPGDSHILEVGNFASTSGTADGISDVMLVQNGTNTIDIWRSTGSSFGTSADNTGTFNASYYGLARPLIADVDHDSFDDIVWQSTGINITLVLRSRIDSLTTPETHFAPPVGSLLKVDTTNHRLRRR